MPIDATGIQLKLTRANEHLGTLTDAAGRWVNEEFRHTETEVVRGEHQWAVYRWAQMSEPDPMWGVYLGDFVHNVRSALDQIVWLCVLANGGSPGKHTQFPFLQSEKEWTEKITSRTDGYLPPTNGVSPQVLEVIMGAQPFHFSGKERSGHPFVRLLRMSNVDKHRTLHVAKVLAGPLSISYSPEGIIKIVNLKQARTASVVRPGAEIGRVEIEWLAKPDPSPQVRIRGDVELAFLEPGNEQPIAAVKHLNMILATTHDVVDQLVKYA